MGETLSFPGLGLEFTLNRVAFSIGGFSIYWYGVIIALAFLAGITYALCRVKSFGLDGDRVIDVVIGGAVGAIAGARLYYVVFSWNEFKDNLWDIFNTRAGGIAIYGGILGGFLVGLLMCKWRKVRMLPMLDLAAGGLILGQAIGRWGNFVNIEAFGGNTSMPWGMTSPSIVSYLSAHAYDLQSLRMEIDPSMPVHPTFFYESAWCLIGFVLLALYTKHRRFDGELLLLYSAWYGLGRAFIEGLRTDSLLLGTLRVSQVVAILCVAASLLIWAAVRSKIRRSGDPAYLALYVNTEEGQSVLAGTFYQKEKKPPQGSTGDDASQDAGVAADPPAQATPSAGGADSGGASAGEPGPSPAAGPGQEPGASGPDASPAAGAVAGAANAPCAPQEAVRQDPAEEAGAADKAENEEKKA